MLPAYNSAQGYMDQQELSYRQCKIGRQGMGVPLGYL